MSIDAKFVAAAIVGLSVTLSAAPAHAKCTRLAFSVNDYGKDGPTKDAKELLDKYIATSMAERGIKNYTVGKKDVTCELFLNLIVVDEHTCRAEANVCWDENAPAKKAGDAAAAPSTPEVVPAAVTASPAAKEQAKPVEPKPQVETGALPEKAQPQRKVDTPAAPAKDAAAADKAVAAAERAAIAAERAAAAAERAAAAAEERAAVASESEAPSRGEEAAKAAPNFVLPVPPTPEK